MLKADLKGLSAARAAFEKNRRNEAARHEIGSWHAHDYRVTLTAIGSPEAEYVLTEHLSCGFALNSQNLVAISSPLQVLSAFSLQHGSNAPQMMKLGGCF
ncbi:hypothetical protein [Sinorhizobium meliloti]|uniref:hypothetical protein n=1 Tax=Rhizobium meliloti TaxID=382 RepID=UPI000FD78361|nr:hypothetical protein [Sinorhizobium meliloti]RVM04183.1 hypothetical protein CN134_32065 [Sinorhizobium meliloti]RVO23325.1 hypothetical protein CN098_30115 [Sinorhizobium meliloti]